MNICVCGWYYYRNFYDILKSVKDKYNILIIAHKDDKLILDSFQLPYAIIDNIGLEFGAYDYYLKNCWDKISNVLFIHDDINLTKEVLEKIEQKTKTYDHAYIFSNEQESKVNSGKHGRAIYLSKCMLDYMYEHEGFWYDKNNKGYTQGKRPEGVQDYNAGIRTFHKFLVNVSTKRVINVQSTAYNVSVLNRVFIKELSCGRRGKFKCI